MEDRINLMTWSQQNWDASLSSKAYNADWWDYLTPEEEPALWAELQKIFEEEQALGSIPSWASELVTRMMELPMCGYYAFPQNILQIQEAISKQKCPDIVMRCYTVDPSRKILMMYYVFCLDAWLKAAPLTSVAAELRMRDPLGKDWDAIANSIYRVLGTKTELKDVIIQRLIHRLRWWIKSLIWVDGDRRDRFMLDFYGGDIRGDIDYWGAYGNSPYGDPYFTELQLPHIKLLEQRILSQVPDGKALLERIHSTWLCAPKVFRYLEKLLVEIGAIDSQPYTGEVPSYLQCEDTYPNFEILHQQYWQLRNTYQLWLAGRRDLILDLKNPTPIQVWLMHILWHKLVFHGTYEETFGKLVGERPHGKSGTGYLEINQNIA
jgi:hypothetical protein